MLLLPGGFHSHSCATGFWNGTLGESTRAWGVLGWLKVFQDLTRASTAGGVGQAVCVCWKGGGGAERPPAGEKASWQTPQFPELIPAPCHCSKFCCFNNIIFIHPAERLHLRRGPRGVGLGHVEEGGNGESARTRFGALLPHAEAGRSQSPGPLMTKTNTLKFLPWRRMQDRESIS